MEHQVDWLNIVPAVGSISRSSRTNTSTRQRRCLCKTKRDAATQKANVLHRAKSFHRKFAGGSTEGKLWRDINDYVTEFFTFDPSSGFCFTAGGCELVIKRRSSHTCLTHRLMQDRNPVDGYLYRYGKNSNGSSSCSIFCLFVCSQCE